jgi:hypothetical protein
MDEDKMVNMLEKGFAEKYGYETNSLSVNAGRFLFKTLIAAVIFVVVVGT